MTSVLEFLNENFKSVTDLAKVDSLISEHQNELERLQQRVSKQAESYPKKLNESLKSTKQSKETLISIQSNKDKLLNLIDTYDVSIPSLSSESSDAKDLVRFLTEKYVLLERFAALHTYLRLLSLADELVEEIRTHNPNSIEKCLVSYQTICKIWTKLVIEEASALDILLESGKELPPWPSIKRLNDALTPNARTGLQSHIFGCITAVYSDITATLEEKLNMLLTKIKWPNQVKASEEFMTLKDDIKAVFRDLLSMNIPEKSGKLKRPVLPIQIMVKPIVLRLKFHFDQPGKPTARLDKPEWIFQYVMNLIEEHNLFLQTQIQLIFESLGYQQINAKMEFIYALEQILSQKFRRDIPKLLSDANLFAHAVTESITFTKTLRDVHGYDVSKYLKENSNEGGVLSSFTDNDEWFSAWIDIETEAGKTRLAEIFDGRDCWNLSFESMTDIDELKLSIASDGFILLLDTISERYKMLPNILRRISFFSEVQLTLLDEYLKFIRGKVDNHANTFKPKITLEQRNDDVFLLSRYCSSLNHVCHTLRDWGEELFYLEMWETIKKGNTSSEQDGDTIFDSIISAYTDEYNRILSILVNDCDQEITESLWQYAKKKSWTSTAQEMSTELVEPVNTIKTLTSTLKANLPHVLYAKVMKQLAKNLDCYLFKRIVQRGTFTLVGVGKFVTDVSILSSRIGKLPRLKDAITLLSLPSESDDDVTKMRRITIRQIFNTIEEGDMEGLQVILNELDVTFLGIEEISYVVDRRID